MRICAICIAAVVSCLFFQPCAFPKAAQPPASPFASTGLLARPDESAEEILLRAHQFDVGAIILAAAGYHQGVGGFPLSPSIAAKWSNYLHPLNALEDLCLLTLMNQENDPAFHEITLGARLATCTFALAGDLAPIFKEEGLFDVRRFCEGLEIRKGSSPNWEKDYREAVELIKRLAQRRSNAVRAVRAFRDEPCSQSLWGDLESAYVVALPEVLTFYAATTHNPVRGTPDWSAERLLRFLDKLNTCEQHEKKKSASGSKNSSLVFKALDLTTREALVRGLSEDREETLSVIRAAHDIRSLDNEEAIRDMAVHYRNGSPGFVKDDMLARLWVQHAAFNFDSASRLALALEWFVDKRYAEAWAWATIIGKDKDIEGKTRRLAAQLVEMIEAHAEKDIQNRGIQYEWFYFHAIGAWIEWLGKQRQSKD